MNAIRAWMFVGSLAIAGNASAVSDDIYLNGFEQFTLTIDNVLAWCSIQENGTSSYSLSEVFNEGTIVDLHAAPITGFIWGHWSGTDNDSGSGDLNQTTTVTMTSDRDVVACCPFPNGTGC